MARLPRYFVPGQPQHIIQRGINRCVIFAKDGDYARYLEWLTEAADRYGLAVHAYVLMTDHMHLLATPREPESIGKVMQSVGRRYVQFFNYSYRRTGTLWEGRYRATVIDSERYLLTCSRYIELNPVRADMVKHPKEYRWSSYGYNALGHRDALVTPHPLYTRLGRSADARRSAYRQLFRSQLGKKVLEDIRDATNKGWALGSERFRQEIEALGRRAAPLPRGRRPSLAARD